tara:strand:+ start:1031 stop:1315 length:285 start_codon:yes stop_codon:yes gene_type:complete
MTNQQTHGKFIDRCERLTKLIGANAPKIIIENEVRRLNEYFEAYEQVPSGKTNGDVYEVDSDDEHCAFSDYCIRSQGMSQIHRIGIKEWRKMII